MTTEHPEPTGFYNEAGFVKSNPLNNESYLEKSIEVLPEWEDILRDTHEKLENLVPGYNIAQIKEKFGGLCYYISLPHAWDDAHVDETEEDIIERNEAIRLEVRSIINEAEEKAPNLLY